MSNIDTRLLALQHARDWASDPDDLRLLDEEIERLKAERRSTARAVPGFTTR